MAPGGGWAAVIRRGSIPPEQTDTDWAKFNRYEQRNKEVVGKPVAVLMGDSITQGWAREDGAWLDGHKLVGRGISGQTTSQMLVRFRRDVIELQPEYVVILAGINDIARNNGYITVENAFKNIVSMVELAQVAGIKPILCTLTPAHEIGWRKRLGDPRPLIAQMNSLIVEYAAAHGIPVVDYHSAMKTEDGAMIPEYRRDAVHPNLSGYEAMEKVLLEVLQQCKK